MKPLSVLIHSGVTGILIILAARLIENTEMCEFTSMFVMILCVTFIVFWYMVLLSLYIEASGRAKCREFTREFYKGDIKIFVFAIVKWKLLKQRIIYIHLWNILRLRYYEKDRTTDLAPTFCDKCLWVGSVKNSRHGYGRDDEEVYPADYCPKCKNEL